METDMDIEAKKLKAPSDIVHHQVDKRLHLLLGLLVFVLIFICYFSWEVMYQERAILSILQFSRIENFQNKKHLEEVIDQWFKKQREHEAATNLTLPKYEIHD